MALTAKLLVQKVGGKNMLVVHMGVGLVEVLGLTDIQCFLLADVLTVPWIDGAPNPVEIGDVTVEDASLVA